MIFISADEQQLISEVRRRGSVSLADLARGLGVKRTTLYYQLQGLVEKGVLLEEKVSAKRKVYRVADKRQLERVVEDYRRELEGLLLDRPRRVRVGERPKLVFCDWYVLPNEMLERLKGGYEIVTYPDSPVRITPEAFVQRCQEADVVVTFFSVTITREMLVACKRLKCLVTATVSTMMIDVEACRELGIEVKALKLGPDYYKKAARTEFVFASLFQVMRPLQQPAQALRLGQFDYRGTVSEELRGKTVGVVGVGREGREIVPLLRAFGCGVMVCNSDDLAVLPGDVGVAAFATLAELFSECDVVIFPEDLRKTLKLDHRYLNNQMRPKYVLLLSYQVEFDVELLRELIIGRKLEGLVIDYMPDVVGVYRDFPHSRYRAIMNFPNVVITPELGFYTRQSMERNAVEVMELLQGLEVAQ